MHTGTLLLGIGLAVASALILAIGNMMQSRGVGEVAASNAARSTGTTGAAGPAADAKSEASAAKALLHNKIWLLGAVFLGLSTLVQMGALAFAPLMVVQPVGVTGLVFTAMITAYLTKQAPSHEVVTAIAVCVIGVAAFVTVSASVSTQHDVTATQLIEILVTLAVVLVIFALVWTRDKTGSMPPIAWVLLGGVFSAFVASLSKTVIMRVQQAIADKHLALDAANILTLVCVLGICVAGALSVYLVQRAHAVNKPSVVIAGLTVVDPTVSVLIGILILGEASTAPWWSFILFVIFGLVAMKGVFMLSKAEAGAPTNSPTGEGPAATASAQHPPHSSTFHAKFPSK